MSYKIGLTYGTMVELASLAIPDPDELSSHLDYSALTALADGTYIGQGYPIARWHWRYLRRAQYDTLRTFCPGASANVVIETCTMESTDAFAAYEAVMLWPEAEKVRGRKRDTYPRADITIEFRGLVPTGGS